MRLKFFICGSKGQVSPSKDHIFSIIIRLRLINVLIILILILNLILFFRLEIITVRRVLAV